MKTDILFIIPPFYRLLGGRHNSVNLGVLYLASTLKKNGYNALIFNADHLDEDKKINQQDIFNSYERFSHDIREHESFAEIRQIITALNPEFIGITITSATIIQAARIAFIAKKINKEIRVLVGGPHVTINHDTIFEYKQIGLFDFIFPGESENNLLRFMNNEPKMNYLMDIDKIPQPDYSTVINNHNNIDYSPMITARGCPYQCSYCASSIVWDNKVRYRSVESICNEIVDLRTMLLKMDMDLPFIDFVDDTFTLNKKRLNSLLKQLKYFYIPWECDTRVDQIDYNTLVSMKESGCIKIKIGVESGSQKILDAMHKKTTVDLVRQKVKMIKEVGIPITAYYMIGLPGETDQDVKMTIDLAQELNADYNSLSIYTPYRKASNFLYHQNTKLLNDSGISQDTIKKFLSLTKAKN